MTPRERPAIKAAPVIKGNGASIAHGDVAAPKNHARAVLAFLGVAGFAVIVALGFLEYLGGVYWNKNLDLVLANLACVIAVTAGNQVGAAAAEHGVAAVPGGDGVGTATGGQVDEVAAVPGVDDRVAGAAHGDRVAAVSGIDDRGRAGGRVHCDGVVAVAGVYGRRRGGGRGDRDIVAAVCSGDCGHVFNSSCTAGIGIAALN